MAKRGYHHGNLREALVEAALDLIEALALLERYLDRRVQYYPPDETVPIDGEVGRW